MVPVHYLKMASLQFAGESASQDDSHGRGPLWANWQLLLHNLSLLLWYIEGGRGGEWEHCMKNETGERGEEEKEEERGRGRELCKRGKRKKEGKEEEEERKNTLVSTDSHLTHCSTRTQRKISSLSSRLVRAFLCTAPCKGHLQTSLA